MKNIYLILCIAFLTFAYQTGFSQENKKAISEMTKEEISGLTYQDLMNLPLEDLMVVANKFGLSADEILEYFLNKDVTSASKRAEKSINSPLSTTVLSREEIIKSGANSIPEALRLIPGMIVREKTPGNFDVHIRGNENIPPNNMSIYTENAMSLVMIDNRPVYNYSFGGTFWETLPIGVNDIERIEVIRGASSALYGPNAVLGTINIITRTPETKKLKADFTGQVGNNLSRTLNGSLAFGVSNKFKVRLSGNYNHFDRFEDDFYIYGNGKRYSYAQLDTAKQYWDPNQKNAPVFSDLKNRLPDPILATNNYGANLYMYYDINKDINLGFATGIQSSEAQTSPLGNIEIPYTDRVSDTRYFDLRARVYGFQFQANHMSGDQDMERNFKGWKISPQIMNTTLEYEKSFGTLVLRPGISYQAAIYDDSKHLSTADQEAKLGFLNGAPELNTYAFFLRADYKVFDKLRTIAAIRSDKYNVPDKTYWTYQFISSYDINANNVVRAVYSRANRGPFIVDSYADYDWPVVPQNNAGMVPYTLIWRGNKNLKMPVVDMVEVGYRFKPARNILVDLEAFYNYTRDVNYFLPDSMTMFFNFTTGKPTYTEGSVKYYNMAITSKQAGITANISIVLNDKLTLKTYMTYQQSRLDNVYPKSLWNNIDELKSQFPKKIADDGYLLTVANGALTAMTKSSLGITLTQPEEDILQLYKSFNTQQLTRLGFLMNNLSSVKYQVGNPDIVNGAVVDSVLVNNTTNQATPDFYGGFAFDYSPTKKLNVYLSSYFFTKHAIIINRKEYAVRNGFWRGFDIDPKFMINIKVSYKVWKDHSIFVNTRNLLNNDKHEFTFTDKIKGTYMVGLNLNF